MSVSGHLFLLAVGHNGAVNTGARAFVSVPAFDIFLCITFEELLNRFPQRLCHCAFLPAVHESFSFSTFLSMLVFIFLNNSHHNRCEVISCFYLHFPND